MSIELCIVATKFAGAQARLQGRIEDAETLKETAESAQSELARLRAVAEAARKYVYSGVDNPIGLDALISALAAERGGEG